MTLIAALDQGCCGNRWGEDVIPFDGERTPGFKLFLAIVVGLALTIPLFSVWLLVYDRQTQSQEATVFDHRRLGRAAGDGGPLLVIPYRATATETVVENGQQRHADQPGRRRS